MLFGRRKKKEEATSKEPEKKKTVFVGDRMDGAGLKYHYENIPIVVTDASPIFSAAEKEAWELSAVKSGEWVTLSTVDGEIGYMERCAEMVGDWIRRKDPIRILLQNYNTQTGEAVVYLAFYKYGYSPDDGDNAEDEG